jgi:hypothetical protein
MRTTCFVVIAVAVAIVACGDDDNNTGTVGGNAAGVGNFCAKNEDCPTNNCYLGPGGGYCTTTCNDEGSIDQCPVDTVCKPIQGGARRCLLICGSKSTCDNPNGCDTNFCPSGSSCTSVSGTENKACEPNPG